MPPAYCRCRSSQALLVPCSHGARGLLSPHRQIPARLQCVCPRAQAGALGFVPSSRAPPSRGASRAFSPATSSSTRAHVPCSSSAHAPELARRRAPPTSTPPPRPRRASRAPELHLACPPPRPRGRSSRTGGRAPNPVPVASRARRLVPDLAGETPLPRVPVSLSFALSDLPCSPLLG